jgi:hypothetical protein
MTTPPDDIKPSLADEKCARLIDDEANGLEYCSAGCFDRGIASAIIARHVMAQTAYIRDICRAAFKEYEKQENWRDDAKIQLALTELNRLNGN